MSSKFQFKIFRARLCFVSNPTSTPTTLSQENGGKKQHLCQNTENQTHQIWRITGVKKYNKNDLLEEKELLGILLSIWIPGPPQQTCECRISRGRARESDGLKSAPSSFPLSSRFWKHWVWSLGLNPGCTLESARHYTVPKRGDGGMF